MTIETQERTFLLELAKQNWRGVDTSKLVFDIQELTDEIEELEAHPDAPHFETVYPIPSKVFGYMAVPRFDMPDREYNEQYLFYLHAALVDSIDELRRRRHINQTYIKSPDREIIKTIKERAKIEDVIEWYCDVFYHRSSWTFRCSLHSDEHPSGSIYQDKKDGQWKWKCFQCNAGGDVIDAVEIFERIDTSQAIAKLATWLGIDLKPLDKNAASRRTHIPEIKD